jgi:hypothetical protein
MFEPEPKDSFFGTAFAEVLAEADVGMSDTRFSNVHVLT